MTHIPRWLNRVLQDLPGKLAGHGVTPNAPRISETKAQGRAKRDNFSTERSVEDPEHLHPPHPDQTVILVVDDEVMLQNIARITLEGDGYFVLTAHDGEEALHISREFPGTIHAVLSDVRMPKMDGMEFRERILKERPGVPILLMSGYVDTVIPDDVAFLKKPFDPAALIDRIHELLASAQ